MKQSHLTAALVWLLTTTLCLGEAFGFGGMAKIAPKFPPKLEMGGNIGISVTELTLDVDVPEGCAKVGKVFKYTARIENQGHDLQTLNFDVEFSHEVNFLSAKPTRGSCQLEDEKHLLCSLGPLEDGGAVEIAIRVFPIKHSDGFLYGYSKLHVETDDSGVVADPIDKDLDQCVTGPADWKGLQPGAFNQLTPLKEPKINPELLPNVNPNNNPKDDPNEEIEKDPQEEAVNPAPEAETPLSEKDEDGFSKTDLAGKTNAEDSRGSIPVEESDEAGGDSDEGDKPIHMGAAPQADTFRLSGGGCSLVR